MIGRLIVRVNVGQGYLQVIHQLVIWLAYGLNLLSFSFTT